MKNRKKNAVWCKFLAVWGEKCSAVQISCISILNGLKFFEVALVVFLAVYSVPIVDVYSSFG